MFALLSQLLMLRKVMVAPRDGLTGQIHAADSPRVSAVVIEIKLARSAAAPIGRGSRRLKSYGVRRMQPRAMRLRLQQQIRETVFALVFFPS